MFSAPDWPKKRVVVTSGALGVRSGRRDADAKTELSAGPADEVCYGNLAGLAGRRRRLGSNYTSAHRRQLEDRPLASTASQSSGLKHRPPAAASRAPTQRGHREEINTLQTRVSKHTPTTLDDKHINWRDLSEWSGTGRRSESATHTHKQTWHMRAGPDSINNNKWSLAGPLFMAGHHERARSWSLGGAGPTQTTIAHPTKTRVERARPIAGIPGRPNASLRRVRL
jgi:hypothetical protein